MLASSASLPLNSARSLAVAAEAWRMEEEEAGGGAPAAALYRLPPADAYVGTARPTASHATMGLMDVDLLKLFASQALSPVSLASIQRADPSLVHITDLGRGAIAEDPACSWAGELGVIGRVQTWRFIKAWSEA
eukprot:16451807-Heterocapsa_arctica.AAC.1